MNDHLLWVIIIVAMLVMMDGVHPTHAYFFISRTSTKRLFLSSQAHHQYHNRQSHYDHNIRRRQQRNLIQEPSSMMMMRVMVMTNRMTGPCHESTLRAPTLLQRKRTRSIMVMSSSSSSSSSLSSDVFTPSQLATVILDGPEWKSYREYCGPSKSDPISSSSSSFSPPSSSSSSTSSNYKFGFINLVIGTIHVASKKTPLQQDYESRRVIGIQAITLDDDDHVPPSVVRLLVKPSSSSSSSSSAMTSKTTTITHHPMYYDIYRESMVWIPSSSLRQPMEDHDILSTYVASLSIHGCIPRLDHVGGSSSSTSHDRSGSSSFIIPGSKVVVLGGSEFACFAAEAFNTLGASVTLVSTRSPTIRNSNVQLLTPSVGELQLGFCSVIGQFDAMLDTLHDERKGRPSIMKREEDVNTNDDDDDDDELIKSFSASVLPLLSQRHSCTRYYSTLTQSQQIIRDSGVLFGPRQADNELNTIMQQLDQIRINNKARQSRFFIQRHCCPPPANGLGQTIQTLLERGIIFSNKNGAKRGKTNNSNEINPIYYARGWSLSDFWEYSTWPRDTSGGDVRYGLPVLTESEFSLLTSSSSTPPPPMASTSSEGRGGDDDDDEIYDVGGQETKVVVTSRNNMIPFVMEIPNIEALQRDIVSSERDCVLFLSASYCRTCKYLQPAYSRLARSSSAISSDQHAPVGDALEAAEHLHQQTWNEKLLFAKADTSGPKGKELGRALSVASVPTFLLFRKGKRYGLPLSITKLPSKRLNLAISMLTQGLPWDQAAMSKLDDGNVSSK